MICGIDYKACSGCGDDCDIDEFIHHLPLLKEMVESDYCSECRKVCAVCGDWVGVCGEEHKEAA